ncbi:M20/M25/M40 family metallo-hydrolase [Virgisporangium ochraceum]|uniref:Vacuolar membrane protease n=1 Tax=Virgisporangium ochraceum TaxID=65505 RepID=A0A8J4EBR5_9ACTN|nr:M20/M25/M40 family metallo-hydrolase [Virgisporangium ochraceum]GIJ68874.1 aminopeptidase [Virgisporangium ochraceum]
MPDRSYVTPARRPLVAAVLLGLLLLLTLGAIADIQPPSPADDDAPAGEFSAGRAFRHVEQIGQDRHVAGSPAGDRVREYLLETLRGYGLETEVQEATGLVAARDWEEGVAARVRNVIARIPGTASTGRVIFVAHYDAVQVSYGANDDGAGVSTLLETARAMKAGPAPRNDVVFLFTDAEEVGMNGAEAFVNLHPLAGDRAVVVNVEARGSNGPAVMFETSRGNADLVDVFAGVPHPVGSSVAVEIYRLLSNDTDFTPFLAHDRFTGLNSAYIDGSYTYHTPLDRPESMSRGSLQHHGDNTLALAKAFGRADLGPLMRPAGHDATYFPVPGFLMRYPGWLVWPLAVLALVGVGALAFLARRRGLTSWPRAAAGFGLALVPLVVAALAAQALWTALVTLRPGYSDMIDPSRPGWFRLAVVALTGGVLFGWYALLRRRIGPVPLAIGGLGVLAVFGVLFAALIPGGSYLAALPALFGAAAGIGALYVRPALGKVAVLGAGAAAAVLVLVPMIFLFFPALGLGAAYASALFLTLLGLALVPVLDLAWRPVGSPPHRLRGAAPVVAALVLSLVFTTVGLAVDRWDARHPLPTHLMYALDHNTGTAQWVSLESSPGTWTARFVRDKADVGAAFPLLPAGKLAVGPAQPARIAAPEVTVLADVTTGSERRLKLRLAPRRPVRLLAIYGDKGNRRVVRAAVEGREISPYLTDRDRFGLQFHGVADDGFELDLTVSGAEPLRFRLIDGSDGLDGLPGFRQRPPNVGVAGTHSSELVAGAITVTI